MQSMPFLLRKSLLSALHTTRATASPVQLHYPRTAVSTLHVRPTPRAFSVCLQCQFRCQLASYTAHNEEGSVKAGTKVDGASKVATEADTTEAIKLLGPDAGSSRVESLSSADANLTAENSIRKETENIIGGPLGSESGKEQSADVHGAQRGGLPSYLEGRRSKWSKQFSTMMDNIQSNVFVAGQRLNDLTGYSGIEALKNEINAQESRLREARAHVRRAKEDYTTAINNRSASQREVNELLQRKHAWSPTDLERFTLLYRNDHTNEVAETETQEALSRAEREAEEAAAQLSRSILSRYHEEQVWSDKIRRMSTWGTWGLMGVNVLLFLIFQIAVEPWRRRRLVKGFEDKVVEALDKKTELSRVAVPDSTAPSLADKGDSTLESQPILVKSHSREDVPTERESTKASSSAISPVVIYQSLYSRIANISSSPLSIEYWRHALSELFSNRSIAVSQRDLTMAAIQSAVAGAAAVGLAIAVVRPR